MVLEQPDGQGLLIKGRVLNFGPLPPPAGPARTDWCVERGLAALSSAGRNYGACMLIIMVHLPSGPNSLPKPYMMENTHCEKKSLVIGRSRVQQWFGLRSRMDSLDKAMHSLGLKLYDSKWHEAEKLGRAALQSSTDAFNWLDDAQLDLGAERLIDVASYLTSMHEPRPMGELVDSSHALVHRAGEVVGGFFGCDMKYEKGRWFNECIVVLMHLRLGNSAGMRVRFRCSICQEDPGDCQHEVGETYPIEGGTSTDGECLICDEKGCAEHLPGTMYEVIAALRVVDATLREVSLTPRPRDPLARIAGRSVNHEYLVQQLGRSPVEGERILDHSCMYTCRGFQGMPSEE